MQDFNWFSRRDFLKGLGLTSLAVATGACESCYNQIKNRPTRRNIANLAANDPIIQTYKDAVSAMKALPVGDGRNWTKQAEIHNNHCVHGNWWFLPWHRAYLFYFEAICRKLTGNNNFALPYWNWTTTPSIPAPFWGNGNPLFDNTRIATQSSVASSSVVGASNITNHVLSETNFLLFASAQATAQNQNIHYGSLPLFGMSCGSANVQNTAPAKPVSIATPASETVTLTNDHPAGSFAVQPDVLKKAAASLEVSVTKVVNPAAKAVTILVHLSPANEKDELSNARISVGNFSLYPVDRPGKFMLDAADALRTAAETRMPPDAKGWRLVFELELQAEQSTAPLEVTIAPPNWKSDKG